VKKFKDIVAQLYRFYDFLAVRAAGLKDIQSVLGAPDLKLTKASETRWLSHDQAINYNKSPQRGYREK